jgi:uncharacterized protein YcaQ
MSVEVSLQDAANFTLSRHHLIEKASRKDAVDVVGDILGLNAQGALNFQLSLWNRVEDLERHFIPKALSEDRSLVRSWFMRDTVHIIPSSRLPLFRKALEFSLMKEWNRWAVRTGTKDSPESWEPLYSKILGALEDGPLTVSQMLEKMGWSGTDARRKLSRLVREMSLRGLICHARSSGPWYHNTQHTFASVDRWLPDIDLDSISEDEASRRLAEMYLRAYGPASVRDFAYWTGMRIQEAKPVFAVLDSVEVTITGQRGTFVILDEDVQSLLDSGDKMGSVRLLPPFDALIMGHRDKSRFIDPSVKKSIFLPRGDVAATILVDGHVCGVWRMRKDRKLWRLELSPFKDFSLEDKERVEEEVEHLRGFTGFEIEEGWKMSG